MGQTIYTFRFRLSNYKCNFITFITFVTIFGEKTIALFELVEQTFCSFIRVGKFF